ncbi:MAG: response regulator, partial [Erysipelotrichales bacterium]|nr:response regulator [Erysipelotrichales bacterium]
MSKILIVDDEEKIRVLIGKYAKFEGYEVVEAKSGIEAITLCESEHFDIIVMDVMMPELDGF